MDREGRRAVFSAKALEEQRQVRAQLDDGSILQIDPQLISKDGNGLLVYDGSFHDSGTGDRRPSAPARDSVVIPVIEEQLEVGKELIERGGVRIHKTVHEEEQVVDQPLMHERVNVERKAVNRIVDGPVDVRYEGDTTVIPVLEEVLVVEKRLILREEIHITRSTEEVHKPQRVVLRREDVSVERMEDPHTSQEVAGTGEETPEPPQK